MYTQIATMPKIMLSFVCSVNLLMLTLVNNIEDSPADPLMVHQSMHSQNLTVSIVVHPFELGHHWTPAPAAVMRHDAVKTI